MRIVRVLFEPWSLGDCVIAAAVLREIPEETALACHPRWHSVLTSAMPDIAPGRLVPIELPYTSRVRSGRFDTGGGVTEVRPAENAEMAVREVLGIRGDIRDFVNARKCFPGSRIRMSGWIPFLARRIRLLDLPYALGWLEARNRYAAWASIAGIPFQRISGRYLKERAGITKGGTVLVHVGAQWISRQYPHVASLVSLLKAEGWRVRLAASAQDRIPRDITEADLERMEGSALVSAIGEASLVICNDSGPMHLSAFLGKPTIAVARTANILEWLPPGVAYAASPLMVHGYRPSPEYMSDERLEGWPDPREVLGLALSFG